MKKAIIFIFILLVAALAMFLTYSGLFTDVKIIEKEVGPYKLVYENHIGPYYKIKDIQDKIYNTLLADHIIPERGFGIYYDNPEDVPQDKLKSIGGCIVEKDDYSMLENLSGKYKVKDYKQTRAIYTTFPFVNSFSIILGVMKVYPELFKYQQSKAYKQAPVLEIYDIPEKKIEFIIPIQDQQSE